MLEGEVDLFSAEALDRVLKLAASDNEELELDLSGIEFIDHHGLLTLLEHARRLNGGHGRLAVRGAPTWVKRACDLLEVAL